MNTEKAEDDGKDGKDGKDKPTQPKQKKKNQPLVYIPPGAGINVKTNPLDPPTTRYENRKRIYLREALKKAFGRDPDARKDK